MVAGRILPLLYEVLFLAQLGTRRIMISFHDLGSQYQMLTAFSEEWSLARSIRSSLDSSFWSIVCRQDDPDRKVLLPETMPETTKI